jgi:hypothetical protein
MSIYEIQQHKKLIKVLKNKNLYINIDNELSYYLNYTYYL